MNIRKISSGLLSLIIAGTMSMPAFAQNDYSVNIDETDIIGDLADDASLSDLSDNDISEISTLDGISLLPIDTYDSSSSGADTEDIEIVEININSADDLRSFRDRVNALDKEAMFATVNLNTDIDLGGEEWVPIGAIPYNSQEKNNYCFMGTFNGNNHTISNFKITNPELCSAGLFGGVNNIRSKFEGYENDVAISNLNVSNADINIVDSQTLNFASIVCGITFNTNLVSNIHVTDSNISANKLNDEKNSTIYSGMVLGYGLTDVDNLSATGNINVKSECIALAGGILGGNTEFKDNGVVNTIKNCTSSVNINAEGGYQSIAGGIAGYLYYNSDISDCSYESESGIMSTSKYLLNTSVAYAAGICGYSFSSIYNCTVGSVPIKSVSSGELNDSSAASHAGTSSVAGIVAYAKYDIKNCSSAADITVEGNENTLMNYVGGITGIFGGDSPSNNPLIGNPGVIENCAYTGKSITLNSYGHVFAGGVTARIASGYSMKNCYAEFDNMTVNSLSPAAAKKSSYVGGVTGGIQGAVVSDSISKGDININGNYTVYAGGISGNTANYTYYVKTDTGLESVITNGVLTGSYTDSNINVSGRSVYAGGISGYLTSSSMSNTTKLDVGQSRITYCRSTGNVNVTAASTSIVGGGIGYPFDSYVSDCYASGDLIINPTAAVVYGGGFAGRLKESIITWEDTENPLSETYNCYASGKVITYPNSPKVSVGPFTESVVSNLAQKPTVEVSPKYANCYYVSEKPVENAVGECVTNISDKSQYNLDYLNIWKITNEGPKLFSELPAICKASYTLENGTPIAINNVTVANPGDVDEVVILLANTLTGSTSIKRYEIGDVSVFEKYFKTIDINLDIPVLTTAELLTVQKNAVSVDNDTILDSAFGATVVNGLENSTSVKAVAASYDENGRLTKAAVTEKTLAPKEVSKINLQLPDNASKLFIWNGSEAIAPVTTVK